MRCRERRRIVAGAIALPGGGRRRVFSHMRALRREDLVGRRITEIIISVPDKPVTMSDMSYSPGYLKLDSGTVFHLGVQPLQAVDEATLAGVRRDTKYEREFRSLLRQAIEDIVLMVD